MSEPVNIPLSEEQVEILRQCGGALIQALNSKFGCPAVLHGVEVASSHSWGRGGAKKIVPEVKYSKQLPKGLKVSVWKDDLTSHKVDAVVNAANEYLKHGGGLAFALCSVGGPAIQQMSDQIIHNVGRVHTGEAVVTPPGNLPCRRIIHAVGPCLTPNPKESEVKGASYDLEKAVWSILNCMKRENLQSVAIPALSSGLFHFPLAKCADIIVKTLKKYHDYNYVKGQTLEIRLVNHDDPSVCEMERACKQILGLPDAYSGAVKGPAHRTANSPISTLQIGNVTLHIKKGRIEEEEADVIVNTTSKELILSTGEISKAIWQKAGNRIQVEIEAKRPHAADGDVIETGGYNLRCVSVYHTICAHKHVEILHKVVTDCLEKAAGTSRSSISFPAIGTGNLGFNKTEVAQIMIKAAVKFAKTFNGRKMDVRFVIFPKDTDTLRVFEKEMTEAMKASQMSSSTTNKSSTSYGNEAATGTTPHIELCAASNEAQREAQKWVTDLLRFPISSLTIKNNHIMHFGQREHEELLSLQMKRDVSIKQFFQDGRAGITITGSSKDISTAGLEVEAMCCKAHEEFAQAKESRMCIFSMTPNLPSNSFHERKLLDHKSLDHTEMKRWQMFEHSGLQIVKVERVENHALKRLFELFKKRLSTEPQRLYQCVPAQFCDLVCRVGFQREYAPPDEQKYGAGIYFSRSVDTAGKLWTTKSIGEEAYVYIVEAQVVTGKTTCGSPNLIVPPPVSGDPLSLYGSVTDISGDTHVIFNSHQALPEYLITCRKAPMLSRRK